MSDELDGLKSWFEANFPKEDTTDPEPNWPEDYEEDEPIPSDGEGDEVNPFAELQAENERLKGELEQAKANGIAMTATMKAMAYELQRYQDASPLLYKLLTDLELDEYRATDYELMILPGTITTERNEMAMEWILRRVYEGGPNDQDYEVDRTDPF